MSPPAVHVPSACALHTSAAHVIHNRPRAERPFRAWPQARKRQPEVVTNDQHPWETPALECLETCHYCALHVLRAASAESMIPATLADQRSWRRAMTSLALKPQSCCRYDHEVLMDAGDGREQPMCWLSGCTASTCAAPAPTCAVLVSCSDAQVCRVLEADAVRLARPPHALRQNGSNGPQWFPPQRHSPQRPPRPRPHLCPLVAAAASRELQQGVRGRHACAAAVREPRGGGGPQRRHGRQRRAAVLHGQVGHGGVLRGPQEAGGSARGQGLHRRRSGALDAAVHAARHQRGRHRAQ
jgi:hypothetical protein